MIITVHEAIDMVLAEVAAEQKRSSQGTYKWIARMCKESWDNVDLREITRAKVQAWIQRRRFQVSASTVNSELVFLNRCFRAANQAGFEVVRPTDLRKPRINNRRERILTTAEEMLLGTVMAQREFSLVQFALHTAMRRLEQFSLRPEDVQTWEVARDGQITLRQGMAKIRDSKTGVGRQCPLNFVAASIAYVWQKEGKEFLFYGDQSPSNRLSVGNWFDSVHWRKSLRAVELVGTGLCWHSLRHTCASRSLRAGARLQDIQLLLGHKSIIQTERYAHWCEDALWPAANALCKGM